MCISAVFCCSLLLWIQYSCNCTNSFLFNTFVKLMFMVFYLFLICNPEYWICWLLSNSVYTVSQLLPVKSSKANCLSLTFIGSALCLPHRHAPTPLYSSLSAIVIFYLLPLNHTKLFLNWLGLIQSFGLFLPVWQLKTFNTIINF